MPHHGPTSTLRAAINAEMSRIQPRRRQDPQAHADGKYMILVTRRAPCPRSDLRPTADDACAGGPGSSETFDSSVPSTAVGAPSDQGVIVQRL